MGTTGLSLFVTVLILHMHHTHHKSPVPEWLSGLLFLRSNGAIHDMGYNSEDDEKTIQTNATGVINDVNETEDRLSKESRSNLVQTRKENFHEQWHLAIRRIDHIFFFIFLCIFIILLILIVYPYDSDTKIDKTC